MVYDHPYWADPIKAVKKNSSYASLDTETKKRVAVLCWIETYLEATHSLTELDKGKLQQYKKICIEQKISEERLRKR